MQAGTIHVNRLPSDAELREWFSRPAGIAIVCGVPSGNLCALDFDSAGMILDWREQLEKEDRRALKDLPCVQTPSGGHHLYFRLQTPTGKRLILAQTPLIVEPGTPGAKMFGNECLKPKIIIETRPDGHMATAPGGNLGAHKSRKPYIIVNGRFDQIPVIADALCDSFYDAARAFDRPFPRQPEKPKPMQAMTYAFAGGSIVEDFDLRGRPYAETLLESLGWSPERDRDHWKKPGKMTGNSATFGVITGNKDEPLWHVFTTEGGSFEADATYGCFNLVRVAQFGGDGRECARFLGERGFGK
jgi:putative DNA primase/helicase